MYNQSNNQTVEQSSNANSSDVLLHDVLLHSDFGDYHYREDNKLIFGSFMQLLLCYYHRVSTQSPESGNKWQEYAYPKMKNLFGDFVNDVTKHLNEFLSSGTYDRDVVVNCFCGYENMKLPIPVRAINTDERLMYKNANVGDIFMHLTQRLSYLSHCDVPKRYSEDENKRTTFLGVQKCAEQVLNDVVKTYKKNWNDLYIAANNEAGVKTPNRNFNRVRNDDNQFKELVKETVQQVMKLSTNNSEDRPFRGRSRGGFRGRREGFKGRSEGFQGRSEGFQGREGYNKSYRGRGNYNGNNRQPYRVNIVNKTNDNVHEEDDN